MGNDAIVIAHEDYLPDLTGTQHVRFFEHPKKEVGEIDNTINFLSFNWCRDKNGDKSSPQDPYFIADAFSAGALVNIAFVCREYFALKYWCSRYECVFVSCNEPILFLKIARTFGGRVQIFDPGHRCSAPLGTTDRILVVSPIRIRSKILRFFQSPLLWLIRQQTLALSDWTMARFAARRPGWISLNSRLLWKGAYERTTPRQTVMQAEKDVPLNFDDALQPENLALVIERRGLTWDEPLLQLLSQTMKDRYAEYRNYFVTTLARYQDLLDSYRPCELVVGSEFYEPYLIAAYAAKARGIKASWLVDGYLVVDIEKLIGKKSIGPAMFDRVYAIGCQHERRISKNKPDVQEVVTIFPPSLDTHVLEPNPEKLFDAIVMTWIPNDLGLEGRNGSRPVVLVEALRAATAAGFEKLAVKIKHDTEREWLLPVLKSAGYLDKVALLEGPFSQHISSARRVIGGVSSAIGECAYHDIPYYIYEPVANGYSDVQLASATVIANGGVARNPVELVRLLRRPEGSVVKDRDLLFGTKCPHPEWTWEQTRELYTSWLAHWADSSGIKKTLQWRGFPLWWSTNLVAKDTAVDYGWNQGLHDRLRGDSSSRVALRSDLGVHVAIVKNLVKEVAKWLLLKYLPKPAPSVGNQVWFHSLEYNFINSSEGFCDRMYEQTPLDDTKHGFHSSYVVRLNFSNANFLKPWAWRQKVGELPQKLRRNVEILDRHLRLADIVQIHASLVMNYFRFSRMAKRLQQHGVRVGHAEFSDILIAEMQKSFTAMLPWSLSYAAMFERWLQSGAGAKTIVTYGETLAPIRAAYFASRRQSAAHRWVSIQHATIYKNKMGFYHRYSEFSRTGPTDTREISPMPDHYFVHGSQFADILEEFYPPEKISIIGCLKYDSLYRIYGQGQTHQSDNAKGRILLLAPSVGDEEIILKMLVGLKEIPGWRVVLSKHPTVSQQSIDGLINRLGIVLEVVSDPTKSTARWMEAASLVVCSYSGIALESFFVGVPSVRVLNPQQPPMVEDEPGVEHLTTQSELLGAMHRVEQGDHLAGLTPEVELTLERYFYKFDGLASLRFWSELGRIQDLPTRPQCSV